MELLKNQCLRALRLPYILSASANKYKIKTDQYWEGATTRGRCIHRKFSYSVIKSQMLNV